MNRRTLTAGLLAALALALTAACSSPSPATNTTNAANSSNAANRAATPASSPAASNANSNAAAQASGAQDFTLVNKTGVEIYALHVSPHASDDWEEDVLGRDTLPDGGTVDIKFDRDEKAAMWDLRIEDKDGNHIEWENLDLLKISKVTLHYKDGKGTAEVE